MLRRLLLCSLLSMGCQTLFAQHYWRSLPQRAFFSPSSCSLNPASIACGRRYDILMPDDGVIFDPLMADPRQVVYSAGWRYNDTNLEKHLIDVSYASTFPFYRAGNLFRRGDILQLELEGGLWAVFDPIHFSAPLINADYYVGVPLTYRLNQFSLRLRFYHISSHLGDEFLLSRPQFDRKNPSAEYLDLVGSYEFCNGIRFYGGYGYVVNSDDSFKVDPNYFLGGGEIYLPFLSFTSYRNALQGDPFFAVHLQLAQQHHYRQDLTVVLGYEVQKMKGLFKKLRVYFEYHDGCSLDGQFCRLHTKYYSLRTSYGF